VQRRGGEIQALQEVVRELRLDSTPELDWQKIEQSLTLPVHEPARAGLAIRGSRWQAWAVAAAAVAAIALGFFMLRDSTPSPIARHVARTPRLFGPELHAPLDGRELFVGDRVVAGSRQARIEHRSRATWTLEPGGGATLLGTGNVISIRLDSGAVNAQVAPADLPESFVIEVGSTRVAVHGTAFRVERRGERAHVEVREGTVSVGAVGEPGATQRWLLHAPAQGHFALDGRDGHVVVGEMTETIQKPASSRVRVARSRNAATAETPKVDELSAPLASSESKLPAVPSIGDVEAGVSRAIDAISGCFSEHTPPRGDMRVTARTHWKLRIAPDGRILKQEFNPPLAPAVEQCGSRTSTEIRFAPSREGISISRTLEISR